MLDEDFVVVPGVDITDLVILVIVLILIINSRPNTSTSSRLIILY